MRPSAKLAAAATILLLIDPVTPWSQQAPQTDTPVQPEVAGRPQDEVVFQQLRASLADRADTYKQEALGFTCRETVIEAKYDVETASHKNSKTFNYDYLFEERSGGVLREYRQLLEKTRDGEWKRKRAEFEPPVPPAYLWAELFSRENEGRFNFRPAGQVVRAYRLLTLIQFIGIAPNPGGSKIDGWSGQVAVDARSLNLWSISAEPTGQEVRLEVEVMKYNKAFAIAGVPLAARPHGWHLDVTFGFEREGLSYPTQQVLSMTSLARDQEMRVQQKTSFKYEDYRFFVPEVSAEEFLSPPPADGKN